MILSNISIIFNKFYNPQLNRTDLGFQDQKLSSQFRDERVIPEFSPAIPPWFPRYADTSAEYGLCMDYFDVGLILAIWVTGDEPGSLNCGL